MAVTVDGFEIPENKIQAEMMRLRDSYGAYVKEQGGEPSEEQLRDWAAENLIEGVLFRKEAATTQPVPSDDRVRQELEKNARFYTALPEEARFDTAREALQQRRMMREIRKGVKQPEDAVARAFYDANPKLFVAPEGVRLSHICRYVDLNSRSDVFLELLRIKAEVERGQLKWMEAVQLYSDTVGRDGGLFAAVGRGELPSEYEEKLFALKPGELSDVIDFKEETLHLFKMVERLDAEKVPYSEVKDDVKRALFKNACEEALTAKFDALKAAAVIVK